MSAAYRDLFINTSRPRMEYSDFPMPESYPDFPHHTQIAAYFDAYVDHFGLRERITFETGVEHATRDEHGVWTVELDSGESRSYDALLVANGHHWNPRWPEPAFPGADTFSGSQLHAHSYVDNSIFAGKRVVVLGMGNSAMDIAVESSYVAERTYLAARQGVWILPKYIFGKPIDQLRNDPRIPFKIRQRMIQQLIRSYAGPPERYGLPKPNHRFGEAHPTVSGRILDRIQHGTITPKPNIASLEGDARALRRRQQVEADVVVYCTGYKITFPFFDEELHLRAGEPHRAVPAGVPSGDPERVLRRPAAAAGSDHAAGRGSGSVGRRLPARRLRAAAAGRAARGHRGRPGGDARALRRLQAPHDPGRLRRLPARAGEGAPRGQRTRARKRVYPTGVMPTFCRHNRFIERCPICSKTLPGSAPSSGASTRAKAPTRDALRRRSHATPARTRRKRADSARGSRRGRRLPLRARARAARLR